METLSISEIKRRVEEAFTKGTFPSKGPDWLQLAYVGLDNTRCVVGLFLPEEVLQAISSAPEDSSRLHPNRRGIRDFANVDTYLYTASPSSPFIEESRLLTGLVTKSLPNVTLADGTTLSRWDFWDILQEVNDTSITDSISVLQPLLTLLDFIANNRRVPEPFELSTILPVLFKEKQGVVVNVP